MAIEYNENMEINYYQTNEIEITNENEYIIYFENLDDFVKLLKTDERLCEELIEKLEDK